MVVRNRRPRETAPGHSKKIEAKCCRKLRLEKVVTTNTTGWPWRHKKKVEQNWKMMQLPNGSSWPWRWMEKRRSKTGEDGS